MRNTKNLVFRTQVVVIIALVLHYLYISNDSVTYLEEDDDSRANIPIIATPSNSLLYDRINKDNLPQNIPPSEGDNESNENEEPLAEDLPFPEGDVESNKIEEIIEEALPLLEGGDESNENEETLAEDLPFPEEDIKSNEIEEIIEEALPLSEGEDESNENISLIDFNPENNLPFSEGIDDLSEVSTNTIAFSSELARPVIYTFFSKGIDDERVLDLWKELWQNSGWEPRVLTLDDAKNHPDYEIYRSLLLKLPNFVSYARWLAMAEHGSGGWMVEYDTIPLGITILVGLELPNNGLFTCYERNIPSLLSGNAVEWSRVVHLVMEQISNGKEIDKNDIEKGYSDASILLNIYEENESAFLFYHPSPVIGFYPYKMNLDDRSNTIDCVILMSGGIWVAHLSRLNTEVAIQTGKLYISDGMTISDRSTFIWELVSLWTDECKPNMNAILGHEIPVPKEEIKSDDYAISNSNALVTKVIPDRNPPIIYTFCTLKKTKDGTIADENGEHENLLRVWEELWTNAGWEPRVLTLDDAKKHPDYANYRDLLLKASYENIWEESFDFLCFARWLAMAEHGSGGWMTDYDTIPIGITVVTGLELPNSGTFTSFEDHVPSLLSGNAEEWSRISHLIMEQAVKGKVSKIKGGPTNGYSDMIALFDIHNEDKRSVLFDNSNRVLKFYPYKVNTNDEKNVINCEMIMNNSFWVVHLSHALTEKAILEKRLHVPDGMSMAERYYYAYEVSSLWKDECKPDWDNILGLI